MVTLAGQYAPVRPRIPQRSTHGLLDTPGVSGNDRNPDGEVWEAGGIRYRPYTLPAAVGDGFDTGAWDPCDGSPDLGWPDPDLIAWPAFPIYATHSCPTMGTWDRDQMISQARRKLENHSSHIIEGVLATGELQNGDTLAGIATDDDAVAFTAAGNDVIAATLDGAATIDTAYDVVPAFQAIYRYAAEVSQGTTVWVHAPVDLIPYLLFYGLARREGANVLLNIVDHRIVLGTGYPGTAPAGAAAVAADGSEQFVYVTSPVSVFMSDATADGPFGESVDYQHNRINLIATRMVIVDHDLQVRGAIKVGLPNPGPGLS